jgi:hypothetical protein
MVSKEFLEKFFNNKDNFSFLDRENTKLSFFGKGTYNYIFTYQYNGKKFVLKISQENFFNLLNGKISLSETDPDSAFRRVRLYNELNKKLIDDVIVSQAEIVTVNILNKVVYLWKSDFVEGKLLDHFSLFNQCYFYFTYNNRLLLDGMCRENLLILNQQNKDVYVTCTDPAQSVMMPKRRRLSFHSEKILNNEYKALRYKGFFE